MKFHQTVIASQINLYLKLKKRKELGSGYCHGLTLLWLFKMSQKKEDWFYEVAKRLVESSEEKLVSVDTDIEKFISYIEWLQRPEKYVPSIRQMDINETMEIPKEIPVSSIFKPEELKTILNRVISVEKMVCVSGPDHSLGVMRRENDYYVYNPNYETWYAKKLGSIEALRAELMECLFTDFNHPTLKLPMIINVLGEEDKSEERKEIYQWLVQATGVMTFCDTGLGTLYLATENHNEELAKMLLDRGVLPNTELMKSKYPLVLASYSGYAELVALLLKYGANPNLEGGEGLPLYLASKHGHEKVVHLLLDHKADVNQQDKDGETAIFAAVQHGKTNIVKILLEHKANPLINRDDGDTAMDLAIQQKNWEMVAMMLMYVKAPHKRNEEILKNNKPYLMAAAGHLQDSKLIAVNEGQKIKKMIEGIFTKKREMAKNPEQCRGNPNGFFTVSSSADSQITPSSPHALT